MNDKGLPKFMHSVVTGTRNDGVYVIHNAEPSCIGKVTSSQGRLAIILWRYPEDMSTDAQNKMAKDMERWFFYKNLKEK